LVARAFGVDEAVLAASLDNADVAPIDVRLKPILRYVRKLTETPSQMTAADAAAIARAVSVVFPEFSERTSWLLE